MTGTETDLFWMSRALVLARRGFAAPNPHVGCVIVRDGEVVAEGCSEPAGGAHAEAVALRAAGERARGATAYVTLEPCNHQGRTGPCSVALAEAGVLRVVYAVGDDNPKARGGAEYLRGRGVEVLGGVCEAEGRDVHRQFLRAFELGRPYVRLKAAVTMDGKIAWGDGRSKWITGEEARADGHRLRLECGCVLVGRGTVEADDPALTARVPEAMYQPMRVVLDPKGRLTGGEKVFGEGGKTVWMVGTGGDLQGRQTVLADFGVEAVLAELFRRGQTGVLVEGGAETYRRFLEAGVVDEVVLYVAPKIFGEGIDWVKPGAGWGPEGMGFRLRENLVLGSDVKLVFEKI